MRTPTGCGSRQSTRSAATSGSWRAAGPPRPARAPRCGNLQSGAVLPGCRISTPGQHGLPSTTPTRSVRGSERALGVASAAMSARSTARSATCVVEIHNGTDRGRYSTAGTARVAAPYPAGFPGAAAPNRSPPATGRRLHLTKRRINHLAGGGQALPPAPSPRAGVQRQDTDKPRVSSASLDNAHQAMSSRVARKVQRLGGMPYVTGSCPGAQALGPLRGRSQAESERRKPRRPCSSSTAGVSRNSSQRHDFRPPKSN